MRIKSLCKMLLHKRQNSILFEIKIRQNYHMKETMKRGFSIV